MVRMQEKGQVSQHNDKGLKVLERMRSIKMARLEACLPYSAVHASPSQPQNDMLSIV